MIAGAYGAQAAKTPTGFVSLLISTKTGTPGPLSSALTGADFSPQVSRLGRSIATLAGAR